MRLMTKVVLQKLNIILTKIKLERVLKAHILIIGMYIFSNGQYQLTAKAYDNAGNVGENSKH